jgi:hypothetical protein
MLVLALLALGASRRGGRWRAHLYQRSSRLRRLLPLPTRGDSPAQRAALLEAGPRGPADAAAPEPDAAPDPEVRGDRARDADAPLRERPGALEGRLSGRLRALPELARARVEELRRRRARLHRPEADGAAAAPPGDGAAADPIPRQLRERRRRDHEERAPRARLLAAAASGAGAPLQRWLAAHGALAAGALAIVAVAALAAVYSACSGRAARRRGADRDPLAQDGGTDDPA